MDISNFKRDVAASEGGQWVTDIPGMGELRLRVRGMGSKVYQTILARLSRAVPAADRMRDGSLKPEISLQVMGQAMHEAILLEWDGLTDNGKPVAYNADLALEWLTAPEYRPFLDVVVWASGVVENGRAAQGEQLEKN